MGISISSSFCECNLFETFFEALVILPAILYFVSAILFETFFEAFVILPAILLPIKSPVATTAF